MELIAGEPDFVVEHLESDCRFTFDFREHERLVQRFEPDDGIVADVMAGVGPFAVPAAKKGCAVIANDLNPNSAKWLRKNVLDNNVAENLRVYCEDGREFIRTSLRRALDEPFPPYAGKKASKRQQKEDRRERQGGVKKDDRHRSPSESPLPARHMRNRIAHFVMNLPDTAIEFLDAFRGILTTSGRELSGLYDVMPMVHCHCFTRYLDPGEAEADIRKRVETALGGELEKEASLHLVRSVAPSKDMYCISFRLPRRVAYA
ncbi:S-adenosyl-L-methionine-dependent methyltransferase [Phellopilus nigrolimitatus]|nr:S-adenosyl-L-methionine-dependent methyltransferase [Phellopilus nigrolimitatus]